MKQVKLAILGIILGGAAILGISSLFTVHQTQVAMVLQFGEPKRVITEPGLQFKMPFIQNVIYYDRRILELDQIGRASCRERVYPRV